MKTRWEQLIQWAKPIVWAIGGGGLTSVAEFYESFKFEGPLDTDHLRSLFLQGAVAGAFAYWRKNEALWRMPPDGGKNAMLKEAVKEVAKEKGIEQ